MIQRISWQAAPVSTIVLIMASCAPYPSGTALSERDTPAPLAVTANAPISTPGSIYTASTASEATTVALRTTSVAAPQPLTVLPQRTLSGSVSQASSSVLFTDNFLTGISPAWGMSGNNYAATNGKLAIDEGAIESRILGDSSWHNYVVALKGLQFTADSTTLQVHVRVQDRTNYVWFSCRYGSAWRVLECQWHKTIDGKESDVADTHVSLSLRDDTDNTIHLKVNDGFYHTILNGSQEQYFVDKTFPAGGVKLQVAGSMRLSAFEVSAIFSEAQP